jgi:hypothetical protein
MLLVFSNFTFLIYAGKLFDAVEKATSDVLESTSLMTQNVVAHKYDKFLPPLALFLCILFIFLMTLDLCLHRSTHFSLTQLQT